MVGQWHSQHAKLHSEQHTDETQRDAFSQRTWLRGQTHWVRAVFAEREVEVASVGEFIFLSFSFFFMGRWTCTLYQIRIWSNKKRHVDLDLAVCTISDRKLFLSTISLHWSRTHRERKLNITFSRCFSSCTLNGVWLHCKSTVCDFLVAITLFSFLAILTQNKSSSTCKKKKFLRFSLHSCTKPWMTFSRLSTRKSYQRSTAAKCHLLTWSVIIHR